MSDVISELREEHENMSRLFKILSREMKAFHAGDGPDWAIIESILDYNLSYPDLYHHPKEDLVLEKLKLRDPNIAAVIGGLDAEHEALAALARRFAAAVRNVMNDEKLPRDWFTGIAGDYLNFMRRHMQMEEVILFPSAERNLTPEDWAEIEARFGERKDPVFGSEVEDRFRALRDEILSESKAEAGLARKAS